LSLRIRERLRDWLMAGAAPVLVPVPEKPAARAKTKVSAAAVAASRRDGRSRKPVSVDIFKPDVKRLHPPGVGSEAGMAMDDANATVNSDINAWAFAAINNVLFDGQAFLGYPLLAELAVRPEYRRISETIALHMTRKWIEFDVKGETKVEPGQEEEGDVEEGEADVPGLEDDADQTDDESADDEFGGASDFAPPVPGGAPAPALDPEKLLKAHADQQADAQEAVTAQQQAKADASAPDQEKLDKISRIEERLEQIGAKTAFYKVAEQDGFFGRAHMYIDLGKDAPVSPDELKTAIGDGSDDTTLAKLANKKDAIKTLKPVEAVWVYPTDYNSTDPLAEEWYKPASWFVMGKQLDASRLLTFVGREVPDILKPAYSFGGLAMSQMVRPYVENWINTRQSVADIVRAFSTFVLSTKLTDALAEDGDGLFRRLEIFNNFRDNSGIFAIDKLDEEFTNVSAPLGSLDKLQAQAQEQMASIAGIPIVLLLMITPSGLNASSEGEIQAFWDWVHAYQEAFFRPNLSKIINMIQVCEFGDVDPDITFTFSRLEGLNDLEWSQKQLADAQRDSAYVDAGIVDAVEVRKNLSKDKESPYHGIDVADVPLPDPSELAPPPGLGGGGPPGAGGPPGEGKDAGKAATGAPAGIARPAVPKGKAAPKELA
jgi:phage-related protein (TIGR01555 family)